MDENCIFYVGFRTFAKMPFRICATEFCVSRCVVVEIVCTTVCRSGNIQSRQIIIKDV